MNKREHTKVDFLDTKLDADTPGARLRSARERAMLTTSDIAEKLKISVHIVEAIEADDYHQLPQFVFVKGYLRAYAKYLKLSGDEIIDAFKQLNLSEPETDRPSWDLASEQSKLHKRHLHWLSWLLLFGFLVAGAVVWHHQKKTDVIDTQSVVVEDIF